MKANDCGVIYMEKGPNGEYDVINNKKSLKEDLLEKCWEGIKDEVQNVFDYKDQANTNEEELIRIILDERLKDVTPK